MHLRLQTDTLLDELHIDLPDTKNSDQFLKILSALGDRPYQIEVMGGISADEAVDKFRNLARSAPKLFGKVWDTSHISQKNFNLWHKDIEYAEMAQLCDLHPKRMKLFLDLHRTLHTAETACNKVKTRLCTYQEKQPVECINFKWFGPGASRWREWPKFVPNHEIEPGDVVGEYPFVGKLPEWCMNDDDITDLASTCKLPLGVAPAFNIVMCRRGTELEYLETKHRLRAWYLKHQQQLASMFSMEEMLSTFGVIKLGRVRNTGQLPILAERLVKDARITEIQNRHYLLRGLAN